MYADSHLHSKIVEATGFGNDLGPFRRADAFQHSSIGVGTVFLSGAASAVAESYYILGTGPFVGATLRQYEHSIATSFFELVFSVPVETPFDLSGSMSGFASSGDYNGFLADMVLVRGDTVPSKPLDLFEVLVDVAVLQCEFNTLPLCERSDFYYGGSGVLAPGIYTLQFIAVMELLNGREEISYNFRFSVPEPNSPALTALGLLGIALVGRFRRVRIPHHA